MMEWIAENKEIVAVLTPVLLDLIAGLIPDKMMPYVGVLRRILRAISKRKGKGLSVLLLALLVASGCAVTDHKGDTCPEGVDSVICDKIADPARADILLQLTNARLLKKGRYDADQAMAFLDWCESAVNGAVTYQNLARQLSRELSEYRLEVLILSGHIDTLKIDLPISDHDRGLLKTHIARQKSLVQFYREGKGNGAD